MTSEISTRILAIVLALFLWASVRLVLRTPDIHRSVRNIPVTLDETVQGFFYQVKPDVVDIELKGPAEVVSEITSVKATVKATGVIDKAADREIIITGLPRGVTYKHIKVRVIPTPVEQKEMTITPVFMPRLAPRLTLNEVLFKPDDTVTVEGAPDKLEKVKYVVVYLNPDSSQLGFGEKVIPRAVDAAGIPVDAVQVNPSTVTVSVSVSPQ